MPDTRDQQSGGQSITMVMTTSFCRIGMSRKVRMDGGRPILFLYRPRYAQQFGAEPELGLCRGGLINVEPYAAIFNYESDHAPLRA